MNFLYSDQHLASAVAHTCNPSTLEAEAGTGQSDSLTAPDSSIWTKTSTTCHGTILTFQILCSLEDDHGCRPVPYPLSIHSHPCPSSASRLWLWMKRAGCWAWRDDSAVWFPAPTLGDSQQLVNPIPGDLMPSTGLHAYMVHIHLTEIQIHTIKIKVFLKALDVDSGVLEKCLPACPSPYLV